MNDFELLRGPAGRNLLIVFDSIGSDGAYRLQGMMPERAYDTLFVNSYRNMRYDVPLDEIFAKADVIGPELRRLIAELKPERVGMFGSSFNAFAAMHFGAQLQADLVLALSPETLIGVPGSRSAALLKGKTTTFPHPDLRATYEAFSPRLTHLYFGEEDFTDIHSAWRMRSAPGVRLHSLAGGRHVVMRAFFRSGFLDTLFANVFDPDFDFGDFPDKGRLTDAPEAIDAWLKGCALLPTDPDAACAALSEAMTALPDNGLLPIYLSRALMRLRRFNEAECLLDDLLKRQPDNERAVKQRDHQRSQIEASGRSKAI